jgi:hypothetical protein
VLPPKANADFVCALENVLEVYTRPSNPKRPVLGCDEASKQLVADVQPPLPPAPGQVQRLDYEYERRGTANLFMVFEPLAGKRRVEVTAQRTKADFARLLRRVVDEWYPEAEVITLVVDNLNTHRPAVLYEVFEPIETRRILERLAFVYTPKHASWLNVAEWELSVLARQCLDRRLPDQEALTAEVAAWERERNGTRVTVEWQFTTAEARVKLKRLYPILEPVKSAEMNH